MTEHVSEVVFLGRSYTKSVRGLYAEVGFSPAIVRVLFKLLRAPRLIKPWVQKSHMRRLSHRFDGVSVVLIPQLFPIIGDCYHRADSFVALDTPMHPDASDCRIIVEERSAGFTEAAVGDPAEDLAESDV